MIVNLLQRYQELCATLNVRAHDEIENTLAFHNRSNSNVICVSATDDRNPLTDDDLKPLALLIKEMKEKQFRLRFVNQRISDKGASLLASLFQTTPGNIIAVLLPFNDIRDEGAGAFGASFANSPSLPSVLDLSGNPISDHGLGLLFRGFSLRTIPTRSHCLHLRVGQTHATVGSETAALEALFTGLFGSLVFTPVSEGIRSAAFDVGTTLIECDVAALSAKLTELEEASAFPATHDAKMKRLASRVADLEKKLVDSEEREKKLNTKIGNLEVTVAKEQELCLKLLRQCQKLVLQSPR